VSWRSGGGNFSKRRKLVRSRVGYVMAVLLSPFLGCPSFSTKYLLLTNDAVRFEI